MYKNLELELILHGFDHNDATRLLGMKSEDFESAMRGEREFTSEEQIMIADLLAGADPSTLFD